MRLYPDRLQDTLAQQLAPAYLIGSLGAYWTIQRTVMML